MAGELKPCPFCEGEAQAIPKNFALGNAPKWILFGVLCRGDCGTFFDCRKPSEAEAIAAWNTRPAPKADSALVGELRGILAAQKSHCDWTHDKAVAGFMEANGAPILAALSDRDVVLEEALRALLDDMRLTSPDDDYQLGWTGAIDAVLSQIPAIRALKGGVDE